MHQPRGASNGFEWWPNGGLRGSLSLELPLPRHFEEAAEMVNRGRIAETVVGGPDPDAHLAGIECFVEAGFDHVYVHQVGPEQGAFLDFYAAHGCSPDRAGRGGCAMSTPGRGRRFGSLVAGVRPRLHQPYEGGDMTQVTSPEELFVHELQDMYYAEKTLTKVLPKLADEATDRELSHAFTSHLKETEKHVANLEKVFAEIGERPQAEPCSGIEGIKKEHDEFVSEQDDTGSKVLDVFLTGAAARTEHYEIAAYSGLVSKARALGERKSVELLQENLRQEKEALKKVESISKRILKDATKNGKSSRSSTARRSATSSKR